MAQPGEKETTQDVRHEWQISVGIGTQMSGIKDEDFIGSNYSPLITITAGRWFAPSLALQVGYKGWYFNTISDEKKHYYGFYFGESVINVKALSRSYIDTCKWRLYLHAGAGYFYNYDYERPNICAHLAISNNYRLAKHFLASLDISAILGWDIYQGDEDILPGITVGLCYLF